MKFSMKKVTVLLADGFEEIEALTVVDLLRRAKVYVDTVSITDDYTVRGAHGIPVQTEDLTTEIDFKESDMIVLPGGMPGTTNLKEDENVRKAVQEAYDDGDMWQQFVWPDNSRRYGTFKGKRERLAIQTWKVRLKMHI